MTKLTQQESDRLDIEMEAIPIGPYINGSTKREYRCVNCGNSYFITPSQARYYKRVTCAKCSCNIRGKNRRHTIDYVRQICIKNGFEPLFDKYIDSHLKIKVRCKCNKICQIVFHCIQSGRTKSCGNCNLKRNGRFTSHTALRLHNIIENITHQKWEHNYHIQGIGCIDIVQPELKIAIEYDGYYWHKNKTEQDKKKYNKLVDLGWKFLNIRSGGYDIPDEQVLTQILLHDFAHGEKRKCITMPSWTIAKNKEKS